MTTKTNASNLISRLEEIKSSDEFVTFAEPAARWAFCGTDACEMVPYFPLCSRTALSGHCPTVIEVIKQDENEWEVEADNWKLIDVPSGTIFRTLSEARKWIAESLYQDEFGRLRIG